MIRGGISGVRWKKVCGPHTVGAHPVEELKSCFASLPVITVLVCNGHWIRGNMQRQNSSAIKAYLFVCVQVLLDMPVTQQKVHSCHRPQPLFCCFFLFRRAYCTRTDANFIVSFFFFLSFPLPFHQALLFLWVVFEMFICCLVDRSLIHHSFA